MNWYLCLLILWIGLLVNDTQAFIYGLAVLKQVNSKNKREQYVILLSDFHDKQHEANAGQLLCIERLLEPQNRATTKIILEDLSTGPMIKSCKSSPGRCRDFRINSRGGILGGLAASCQSKGFNVDNVEYRYCRVAALGPVLENSLQELHKFPSTCGILVCDLAHEIYGMVHDVRNHIGSDELALYRDRTLGEVQPQIQELQLMHDSLQSVADYVHHHSKLDTRLELLKRLLTFDGALLDLKLAHSIITSKDYDKIVVIAGGSHSSRVKDMLMAHGYELVYAIEAVLSREYNVKRCVGSTIVDGLFCIRPEPIDLMMLKRYL